MHERIFPYKIQFASSLFKRYTLVEYRKIPFSKYGKINDRRESQKYRCDCLAHLYVAQPEHGKHDEQYEIASAYISKLLAVKGSMQRICTVHDDVTVYRYRHQHKCKCQIDIIMLIPSVCIYERKHK